MSADRLDTDTQTGTQPGTGTHGNEIVDSTAQENQELSALGERLEFTPLVIPIRAHLDSVRRLLKGDIYIGRVSRQRSLPKNRYCNNFKVSVHGREAAIAGFRDMLLRDRKLYSSVRTLSGTRLVCHCRANEAVEMFSWRNSAGLIRRYMTATTSMLFLQLRR